MIIDHYGPVLDCFLEACEKFFENRNYLRIQVNYDGRKKQSTLEMAYDVVRLMKLFYKSRLQILVVPEESEKFESPLQYHSGTIKIVTRKRNVQNNAKNVYYETRLLCNGLPEIKAEAVELPGAVAKKMPDDCPELASLKERICPAPKNLRLTFSYHDGTNERGFYVGTYYQKFEPFCADGALRYPVSEKEEHKISEQVRDMLTRRFWFAEHNRAVSEKCF